MGSVGQTLHSVQPLQCLSTVLVYSVTFNAFRRQGSCTFDITARPSNHPMPINANRFPSGARFATIAISPAPLNPTRTLPNPVPASFMPAPPTDTETTKHTGQDATVHYLSIECKSHGPFISF